MIQPGRDDLVRESRARLSEALSDWYASCRGLTDMEIPGIVVGTLGNEVSDSIRALIREERLISDPPESP